MDLPLDLDAVGGPGLGLAAMAGVLVVLALIDSTSFGTLLIPVWLLLAPGRLRAGRVLVYLGTVAGFYLAVGIVVLLGAGAFLDRFGDALDTRAAAIVQLLLGIGLFALSFRFDSKRAARKDAQSDAAPSAAGRPDAVGPSPWTGAGAGTAIGLVSEELLEGGMPGEQQPQLLENRRAGPMPVTAVGGHRFGRFGTQIAYRHSEHVRQSLQNGQSLNRQHVSLDLRHPAFRAPNRRSQLFLR